MIWERARSKFFNQAPATAGQYENEGKAEGLVDFRDDGSYDRSVEDTDLSHYFGEGSGPGPSIPMLPAAAIPAALVAVTILGIRRKRN